MEAQNIEDKEKTQADIHGVQEKSIKGLRKKRYALFFICLVLLVIAFIYGLSAGSVQISFSDVIEGLKGKQETMEHQIVWNLRLPRLLTDLLVGMCLAVSGALLQGIMRNPLADPGVIGVSAGAGLLAILTMLVFPEYINLLPLGAFLGAFVAATFVYLLAWDGGASPVRLILAGVAINTLLSALTSAVMIIHSDKVQTVLPFLMGGLSERSWNHFYIILPYALIGLTAALFASRAANILRLGDNTAKLLGYNVEKNRLFLLLVSTFLAGAAVSVAGLLRFVGLVIPHIIRLLIGNDYRFLIPISMVFGGRSLCLRIQQPELGLIQ